MTQDRIGKDFRDLARLLGKGVSLTPAPWEAGRKAKKARKAADGARTDRAAKPEPPAALQPAPERKATVVAPRVRYVPEGQDIFGTPTRPQPVAESSGSRIARTAASIASLDLRALSLGEGGPTASPGPGDRDEVRRRLTRGATPTATAPGAPLVDLVVGLDVGSTSTKIVLRTPYAALMKEGRAVPVPGWLRSGGHRFYWRTSLWSDEAGRYSLFPEPGATSVDRLKLVFLEAVAHGGAEDGPLRDMTAWIALMVRQSLGWLAQTQPWLVSANRLRLALNAGFPAGSCDDPPLREAFCLSCRAAWRLAFTPVEVSQQSIAQALAVARGEAAEDVPEVRVVPEFVGAIAGFARSIEARDGRFVLLDVGGLTADCVFFRLSGARSVDPTVSIYDAQVERFGVEVTEAWVAQDRSGLRAGEVAPLVGSFLCQPIRQGHDKLRRDPTGASAPAVLFVVGGGRHSAPHRRSLGWAVDHLRDSIFATHFEEQDLAPRLRELAGGAGPAEDCNRLLIAHGLSFPADDLPQWRLPRQIPDVDPPAVVDLSVNYVGPEQV